VASPRLDPAISCETKVGGSFSPSSPSSSSPSGSVSFVSGSVEPLHGVVSSSLSSGVGVSPGVLGQRSVGPSRRGLGGDGVMLGQSQVAASRAGSSLPVPQPVPRGSVPTPPRPGSAVTSLPADAGAAGAVRGLGRGADGPVDSGTPSVALVEEPVGASPWIASALLSSVPASVLVDSGSSHSLMPSGFARAHGFLLQGSRLPHVTLADGGLSSIDGVVSVTLELGGARLECLFFVVPVLAYEAILGMDVLKRLKATLVCHTGRLASPFFAGGLPLSPVGRAMAVGASSVAPSSPPVDGAAGPGEQSAALAEPVAFEDLLSAWDPAKWSASLSKSLSRCRWPSSHQALVEEFRDVFAPEPGAPGVARVTPFRIITTSDIPVVRRGRRHSHAERQTINAAVLEMVRHGIIKPSISPYSSPIVLIPKGDGSSRFCINFQGLNEITETDPFPMPLARAIFDALGGFSAFNVADLAAGFFQIPMHPDDMRLTAFSCDLGHFEFTCMPFGLKNGPAAFCRAMSEVFSGLSPSVVSAFIDDLISPAASEVDSLAKLRLLFTRLRAVGFHLRLDKCHWACAETGFLGHIVSAAGLAVDPVKVTAVQSLQVPSSVLAVRQFIGLTSYYRSFIPNYARIAAPLTALTRSYAHFHWTSQCESAFRALQAALTSPLVLAFPDFSRPFILSTDASRVAIGAILSQQFPEGERPIAYASRQLKPNEKRWTVFELEGLAVVWGTKYFDAYLHGREFTVVTDHRALSFLDSPSTVRSDRMERWVLQLSRYKFRIVYRPGTQQRHVDALSRLPVSAAVGTLPDAVPLAVDALVSAQRDDGVLGPILAYLSTGALPSAPLARDLVLHQSDSCAVDALGRLCVRHSSESLVWIPSALVPSVLRATHDALGHLGADRTLARLRPFCFWASMVRDVSNWCRSCVACARAVTPRQAPAGLLQPIVASEPFELVVMDYLGPLRTSASGNKYVLVFMDKFSKWVEVVPCAAADGATTVHHLSDRILCHWRARPARLLSDNGSHFVNAHVAALCTTLGIKQVHGLPYHPQTQGLVERFNATLVDMVRKLVSVDQLDWDAHLHWLAWAYNTSVHASTGLSPFEVLRGIPPASPLEALAPVVTSAPRSQLEYATAVRSAVESAVALVSSHTAAADAAAKRAYDARHRDVSFAPGDQVMVHVLQPRKGLSPKLQSPWKGPWVVVDRVDMLNYRIRRDDNSLVLVPVSRLKPFEPRQVGVAARTGPAAVVVGPGDAVLLDPGRGPDDDAPPAAPHAMIAMPDPVVVDPVEVDPLEQPADDLDLELLDEIFDDDLAADGFADVPAGGPVPELAPVQLPEPVPQQVPVMPLLVHPLVQPLVLPEVPAPAPIAAPAAPILHLGAQDVVPVRRSPRFHQ